MTISFETSNPAGLLAAFKKGIDGGHIVTWTYDSQGDFTHNTDQWRHKAYLRPQLQNGRLVLVMLGNTKVVTTWAIYGIYQGRFIESMIAHCHDNFTVGSATAAPTNSDQLTSRVA